MDGGRPAERSAGDPFRGPGRAAIEQPDRELQEFASAAAHDLQEPLRKIVAFSGLLREDVGPALPEAAEQDLSIIVDAAERMQRLVRDLLALSRVQTSPLEREPLALDECAGRALETLSWRIEQAGGRVERDPLPVVEADRSLVDAIYHHLIANAIAFAADRPPRIELTARRGERGWLLGVRDNGVGVPPEFRDEVFKPFRRLGGAGPAAGSGLGLAICRRAVERHGGSIRVEPGTDGGAHFLFTLEPENAIDGPTVRPR